MASMWSAGSQRVVGATIAVVLSLASSLASSLPTAQPQRAAQPSPPGGRGGGRGRGAIQVMTLTSTAFADGGQIPSLYTQAGEQASPPLQWANVPDGVVSFVIVVHDPDAAIGNGTDDLLHWLLWNIPGSETRLEASMPHGPELPGGIRQISATGPFYRGPGAAAAGPAHHYVFELFALDTMLDVPPVGVSPAQTRAAVMSAMAGHVRGKAAYIGQFKR